MCNSGPETYTCCCTRQYSDVGPPGDAERHFFATFGMKLERQYLISLLVNLSFRALTPVQHSLEDKFETERVERDYVGR